MSKLYGIGVGPGDPEELTLKAIRIIKESDVLLLPAKNKEECYAYKIVAEAVPEVREKEIRCYHFPMTKDKAELRKAHDAIYEDVQSLLQEGKILSFLTIGDPTIYSTYNYIHKQAVQNGWEAIIINGITSFCAVAAKLGIALSEQNDEIHIIPANKNIEGTEKLSGTRIYMKSGRKLVELINHLQWENESHPINVCAVANCGMANERIYRNFSELSEEAPDNYLITVIVRTGVVSLSHTNS